MPNLLVGESLVFANERKKMFKRNKRYNQGRQI